jgi:phosphotransferase system HPr-like phosphotransfer protein
VGTRLTIRAEGPDAESAVEVIGQLFAGKFGEE